MCVCACFHHLELEPLIWIKHYGNGRPVPAILLVRPLDLDISLHIWWPGGLSLCRQGFFLLSNRRNALMTLALHLLPLGCPVPEFLILRKIREHFRNLMFHPQKKTGLNSPSFPLIRIDSSKAFLDKTSPLEMLSFRQKISAAKMIGCWTCFALDLSLLRKAFFNMYIQLCNYM